MKYIRLSVCVLIPLVIMLLPTHVIPLEGITIIEQRVIAIFVFAALSWILEPIPIYTTSLAIIFLELIMLSDKSLILFQSQADNYGSTLLYRDILHTFASPIIILFFRRVLSRHGCHQIPVGSKLG